MTTSGDVKLLAWHDGAEIPPVKVGSECEYIVAVYRKSADKTYTFAATYLNQFRVENNDAPCKDCDGKCEDEGTCPLTGWFQLTGDSGYDAGCYWGMTLCEGDKLRAWCELPKFVAAPDTRPIDREKIVRAFADKILFGHEINGCDMSKTEKDFYRVSHPSVARRLKEFADAILASQSAPSFKAAHNSGESDPSVTLDCGGADTADRLASQPMTPIAEDLAEALADGHLALDRAGAPRDVFEKELSIAERIEQQRLIKAVEGCT